MRYPIVWGLLLLAVLAALRSSALCADGSLILGPDHPDFLVQGEYSGEVTKPDGKKPLGVQVLARDNGKFHAVGYYGGLPGAGWDKSEPRQCDGQTTDGTTTFQDGAYTSKIHAGEMVITADGGALVGKLQKVSRRSPTLEAKPPAGAVVLFDGHGSDQFDPGQTSADGLLMPGATSKRKFRSGTLHLEFRLPFAPLEPSRGNSGCYLQSRYEVQILDSFGLAPHNHECGGIPSVKEPDLSMCYPPLAWQTYDVVFTAAQYENGKKVKNARMTLRHNGTVVHDDVEVPHATTSSPLPEGSDAGPLNLQEHGGEVRFRNIWFLEKT